MTLPVFMYHDITPHAGQADYLTIPVAKLEQQFQYIRQQGYTTISLQQFHQHLTRQTPLPAKPLLITFDDGYISNAQLLPPLLRQYRLRAGIFLVTEFVQMAATSGKYMATDDLRRLDRDCIDFGYHSFSHRSYGDLSIAEAKADLQQMKQGFSEMNVPIVPLFAYPYGASPRKEPSKMQQLETVFQHQSIDGAFRIGNRLSSLPATNCYQVQRIDVRGTDPFWKFKLMLRFGRKWL